MHEFAVQFQSSHDRLDLLINNLLGFIFGSNGLFEQDRTSFVVPDAIVALDHLDDVRPDSGTVGELLQQKKTVRNLQIQDQK